MRDLNTSANGISDDLKKIEAWAHQRKIILNPYPLLETQEVTFLQKINKPHHPSIFQGNLVKKALTKNVWVGFSIAKLIFMKILKKYLIKLVNLVVLFVSSGIFYPDHHF